MTALAPERAALRDVKRVVVKIGSRQIVTSLKTKLNSLKLALKEVG